jgi:acyl-CoA thioester hydrolase
MYEGTVPPEEIDHLGHMNVHFYATKARSATRALAGEYGLSKEACDERGVLLAVPDTFTRHYREQLVGARLAVMTGVLSVSEQGLRLYHELVNRDSGELAATFVHHVQLQDRKTRAPCAFPAGLAERAQASIVGWPEHGKPRTADLGSLPTGLTLSVARERSLESRKPRVIEADACDADGYYDTSFGPELVWGGEPISRRGFTPLHETEDGKKFGWATLESRHVMVATPRVGARIQSFSAEVELARKTSYRHSWVFDLDREEIVCISSNVNLAFDIGARKSMEIPDAIRANMQSEFHPDLA